MMSLKAELEALRAAILARVSVETSSEMREADLELTASSIFRAPLKAGDIAPDFALPDARGGTVSLRRTLLHGPVAVSFYLGGWCPYCNLELRALRRALPEMSVLGASLIAISPQSVNESLSTAENNALAFPVLSDTANVVATAFGIACTLEPALRWVYSPLGDGLIEKSADDKWCLPIPATYVIDVDNRIVLASLDTDYRCRLEPAAIIAALRSLRSISVT